MELRECTKACAMCGAEFTPPRMGAPKKYCGSRCKDRARNRSEKRKSYLRASGRRFYTRHRERVQKWHQSWLLKNPNKEAEYSRTYRETHPEKVSAAAKRYNEEHRDVILIKKREYHQKSRDKEKAYVASRREHFNEYAREWQAKVRAQNPAENRRKQNDWYARNPAVYRAKDHRRRSRLTGAGGSYTSAEWNALLDACGHKCLRCGRSGVKLTVDHIVPVILGGTSNIDNIQPLCKSCNSSKHKKIVNYRAVLCL